MHFPRLALNVSPCSASLPPTARGRRALGDVSEPSSRSSPYLLVPQSCEADTARGASRVLSSDRVVVTYVSRPAARSTRYLVRPVLLTVSVVGWGPGRSAGMTWLLKSGH